MEELKYTSITLWNRAKEESLWIEYAKKELSLPIKKVEHDYLAGYKGSINVYTQTNALLLNAAIRLGNKFGLIPYAFTTWFGDWIVIEYKLLVGEKGTCEACGKTSELNNTSMGRVCYQCKKKLGVADKQTAEEH